jgi:MFS family permease
MDTSGGELKQSEEKTAPLSTRPVNRGFYWLCASQSVSTFGSSFTSFALPTVAILWLHASPLEVGALAAMRTIPFPIVGMFAGVVVDRFSRRNIMLGADVLRGAAMIVVAVSTARGMLNMPLIYVVTFFVSFASVFFDVAQQSIIRDLISTAGLIDANAKLEVANTGSSMLGNALAGIILRRLGVAVAIGIDACSYLISGLWLTRISFVNVGRRREPLTARRYFSELIDGVKTITDDRALLLITKATFISNLAAGAAMAIIYVFAYDVLFLRPDWLGIVFAAADLGVIAAFVTPLIDKRLGLRGTLIASELAGSLGILCLLLGLVVEPYLAMFLATFLSAISLPIYNVSQISFRQARVAPEKLARTNATMRSVTWLAMPLGSIGAGHVSAVLSVKCTVAICALLFASGVIWLLKLPGHEGASDPA